MQRERITARGSLWRRTWDFLHMHEQAIAHCLEPSLLAVRADLVRLPGRTARSILGCFDRASRAWEKYFWACLAYHWVVENHELERALNACNRDLLGLAELIDTVVIPTRYLDGDTTVNGPL